MFSDYKYVRIKIHMKAYIQKSLTLQNISFKPKVKFCISTLSLRYYLFLSFLLSAENFLSD